MPSFAVSLAGVVVPPMPNCVSDVVSARVPTKVLNAIVQPVAIGVTAFHSTGARSNKRFQYQPVDGNPFASPQGNVSVPMIHNGGKNPAAMKNAHAVAPHDDSIQAANTTKSGDLYAIAN